MCHSFLYTVCSFVHLVTHRETTPVWNWRHTDWEPIWSMAGMYRWMAQILWSIESQSHTVLSDLTLLNYSSLCTVSQRSTCVSTPQSHLGQRLQIFGYAGLGGMMTCISLLYRAIMMTLYKLRLHCMQSCSVFLYDTFLPWKTNVGVPCCARKSVHHICFCKLHIDWTMPREPGRMHLQNTTAV